MRDSLVEDCRACNHSISTARALAHDDVAIHDASGASESPVRCAPQNRPILAAPGTGREPQVARNGRSAIEHRVVPIEHAAAGSGQVTFQRHQLCHIFSLISWIQPCTGSKSDSESAAMSWDPTRGPLAISGQRSLARLCGGFTRANVSHEARLKFAAR